MPSSFSFLSFTTTCTTTCTTTITSRIRQAFKTVVVFGTVPFWTAGLCVNAYVLSVIYAPCTTVRTLLLLYLPYCFLDRSPQRTTTVGNQWWRDKWIRHLPQFHTVADYFPVKLHKTVELPVPVNNNNTTTTSKKEQQKQQQPPPPQAYLFCYHPHGVISMGANAALSTNGCNFDRVFPGLQRKSVTLNLLFHVPFFREYILAAGYVSANKETMRNHLQTGCSLVLIPGGAAEALHAHPDCMEVMARRRRGFLQLAYECQAALVPCLGFGENRAFSTYIPPHDDDDNNNNNNNDSNGRAVLQRQGSSTCSWNEVSMSFLARTVRSLQRAWCRWTTFSVPLLTSLMPHASPIDVVVGAPVLPPPPPLPETPKTTQETTDKDNNNKNADPDPDAAALAIEEFHQRYWQAVQELYDEHKSKYGYQDIPLVLL